MSERLETAKIEFEIAEDYETVTASELVRWIKSRRVMCNPAILATIERAVAAVGRAKRLRKS